MFVSEGAQAALLKDERERFLLEEWPRVYATIQRLGLSAAELLAAGAVHPAPAMSGSLGRDDHDDHH
jgi:hypothetical protein